MRLFLDECLSPAMARALNAEGAHAVMHPRDFGGRGAPDRDAQAAAGRATQSCAAPSFASAASVSARPSISA